MRTLALSRSAVMPCLSALNQTPDVNGCGRWSLPVHTLIIRPDSDQCSVQLYEEVSEPLLRIAQKRKVAGFLLRYVSLFISDGLGSGSEAIFEDMRKCVERLEVILGDDVLDWGVDKYFLDGLDHLQRNLDVQWDL